MGEKTACIKTMFATDNVISIGVAIVVSAVLTYFSYTYYNTYWISTHKLTVFTFLSIMIGSACGYSVSYFSTMNLPPSVSKRRSVFIFSSIMSVYSIVFGIDIIWRKLDTWGAYVFLILLPLMVTLWSWRQMQATEDRRGIRISDGHMVVSRAQIQEIDISQPANALLFLRFTDYTLVMLCSYILPPIIVIILFADIETRIGGILITLPLLFAVYTGWRNVGVIGVQRWPAYFFLFLVFSFISAYYVLRLMIVSGLIIPPPSYLMDQIRGGVTSWQATAAVPAAIISVTQYIWFALIYFCGFISVLLLKGVRIEPIGMPLLELLFRLRSYRPLKAVGAARTRKINTPVGIAVGTFGCFLILFGIFLPIIIGVFLVLMGFFLLIRARRYFQVRADSLLSTDKRNPILFLRSFYDDQKQRVDNAAKAIVDFSLEVRLANHFNYFGPFIAVGSPMETVPQLGAARVMLSEDEWQSKVMKLISEASLIIMYAGKTQWVNWELGKIIETARVQRLILVIPEVRGLSDHVYWVWSWRKRLRDRSKEIAARMERVKDAFKNTIWSTSLATLQDSEDIRAMLFDSDGSMVIIKSGPRNRDSYHLGVLIAHFLMLKNIRKVERKE